MQNKVFTYNIKKSILNLKYKINKRINIENVDAVVSDSDLDMTIDDNVFLHSLHYLSSDDIELNEAAKNIKKPKPDYLKYAVLLLCACIFFYSGSTVVQTFIGYIEARNSYNEIRNIFYDFDSEIASTDLARPNQGTTETIKPLQDWLSSQLKPETLTSVQAEYSESVSNAIQNAVQLDKLKALNPDTYGWIRVNCPNDNRIDRINYIMVQSADNDYYLDHDFYKNPQKAGAIYGDFRISRNVDENFNTIVYGHNMGDQSMFGPLLYFGGSFDKFNSGTIEISTWDGTYVYEIFSVYETYPDSRGFNFSYIKTDFASEEEYVAFLEELKSKSAFEKDVKLTADSRIVTLSTCTNNLRRDTRFAVHGVLTEILR